MTLDKRIGEGNEESSFDESVSEGIKYLKKIRDQLRIKQALKFIDCTRPMHPYNQRVYCQ